VSADTKPEPWLRGPIDGLHPLLAPVFYAFIQAREDLDKWTRRLSDAQIWERPRGLAPAGFHIRHIAGSVDRLMTYLKGDPLSDAQLTALEYEIEPDASRDELLQALDDSLRNAEAAIRGLDPGILTEARHVGRKKLPTTVIGLLTHIAEHTQRHVGEAIITAKIVAGARQNHAL
jgi:hypothetical protein